MKKLAFYLFAIVLFGTFTASAQNGNTVKKVSTPPPPPAPTASEVNAIPLNPDVKVGQLSNGIKYYIQKNVEPANRMELRLAVNAGSMQETDAQQGLAHFCEHMAFNGTKNFKKLEIVDYLESIGTKFGAHLNAYTSFDETVYMLQAPTDDKEIMDKAVLILSDWASKVSFEDEEIEKERGVVIEEWRLGQGANERMRKEWWPIAFKDSRYAERLPIGKKDILESFNPQLIKDFYKDWYRPDLMAVVAVGDFDVAEMEKLIKQKFASIPAAKNPKEKILFDVPVQDGLRVAVATDKEAQAPVIRMAFNHPKFKPSTLTDWEKQIQIGLIESMIRSRYSEYTSTPGSPFRYAGSYYGAQVRTRDAFTIMAYTDVEQIEKCLREILLENKRLVQYGFNESELERAKTQYMTGLKSRMKDKDKTPSRRIVMEYVYNYLNNDPVPGIEFEYNFANKALAGISMASLNELVKELLSSNDKMVTITGPEKPGVEYPNEVSIRNLIKATKAVEVQPYVDKVNNAPLVSQMPESGSIVSEKKLEAYGAIEWKLSNGASVIVKNTDFKNDEIVFSAESKGGYSHYEENVKWSAMFADAVIDDAGIADFDQSELRKKLAGKRLYIRPYISAYEEGFGGMSSPDDLETFMQLLHLYFTSPRKDAEALDIFKAKYTTFIENQAKSPEGYYSIESRKVMTQNHPWAESATVEGLNAINLEKVHEIFADRFESPSDFTFYFVGNVPTGQLKQLVATYIASIPAGRTDEEYIDLGIRPPSGKVEKTVYKGSEPKSSVSLSFTGKYKAKKYNSMAPKALEKALGIKLRQALREDQGGTYGVGCRISISETPYSSYTVSVQFGCAPENVDQLVKVALEVIEDIRKNGISEEDMAKFRETAKREHEAGQTQNRFWLNRLKNYVEKGEDATTPAQFNEKLNSLTNKEVQKLGKKLLNTKKFILVVLKPEE